MAKLTTRQLDDEDRVWSEFLATLTPKPGVYPDDDRMPPLPPPEEPEAEPQLSVESLPEPAPQVEPEPEKPADVWQQFVQSAKPARSPGYDYEPPPEVKPRDTKWLWIATALDAVLNGGESIPMYVAQAAKRDDSEYENWNRRNKAKNDASMRAQRAELPWSSDPRAIALRERALGLRERGLQTTEAREGRLADKFSIENDPTSAAAQRVRDALTANGVPAEATAGLSIAEMKSLSPAHKHWIENNMKDVIADTKATAARATAEATIAPKIATAKGISDATFDNKLALVREGAAIRNEAAANSPGANLDEQKFFAAEADKYNKFTEFYRTGAVFIDQADRILAKYGEGEDLPGIGMLDSRAPDMSLSDDGLTLRQAQNWMNNAIQRADSGAAAPIPEELKFAIRSGSKPGATEREVQAGLRAARMYLRTQLRGASVGHPEAARAVMRASGLEGWLGSDPQKKPTKKPTSKPTGQPAVTKGRKMSQEEWDEIQDLGGDF